MKQGDVMGTSGDTKIPPSQGLEVPLPLTLRWGRTPAPYARDPGAGRQCCKEEWCPRSCHQTSSSPSAPHGPASPSTSKRLQLPSLQEGQPHSSGCVMPVTMETRAERKMQPLPAGTRPESKGGAARWRLP